MTIIKNFIYLDDYKMYSMSSQLSGGVVHSESSYKDVTKKASQNIEGEGLEHSNLHEENPIIEHGFGGVEHKHVHDYAYIDFENRLRESGKIISLSSENLDTAITQLSDKFIEIRGKAVLIDMNDIRFTVSNFNKISNSLTEVVNFSTVELINQQIEEEIKASKDRNEKVRIEQRGKSLINAEKSKNPPIKLDEDYIKNLESVLEYGFRDQFVIQISIGSYRFSAECDPDDLREKKDLLIRRFSRFPEAEFVIIGTISQSLNQTPNVVNDYLISQTEETSNMKSTIMNLIQGLSEIESSFIGREKNEIIIDPIAVYWEI